MYDTEALDILLGGSIIIILILFVFLIAFSVLYTVSLWKLFKKAGKNGWESLVPIYNTYVLIEISGLNWWYFLLAISGTIVSLLGLENLTLITSILSLVVNFFIFYNLAKRMHKDPVGIAIAGIFVPGIIVPILGLSKNITYDSSVAVSPNGPIGEPKENENNYTNNVYERYCLGCGKKLNPNNAFCENCGKKVE